MTELATEVSTALSRKRASPLLRLDLSAPAGEPALVSPDSVSWQVFKNPIALFIGGVTAVLLEFAEPKIRSGVWDHSTFRTDPMARMQRTGVASMVSVYGPRSRAEQLIAGVVRMHDRVKGTTPSGEAYHATDIVLLDWVQCTAGFGFLEAYCAFVEPLSLDDKDRYYREGQEAARLFGAVSAPQSVAEVDALFETMRPRFEPSPIVFEFLDIMMRTPIMPSLLRPFQRMLVRAGVEMTPPAVREVLGLGAKWGLRPWEARFLKVVGKLADRVRTSASPQVQACRRLGLPANYLYAKRS